MIPMGENKHFFPETPVKDLMMSDFVRVAKKSEIPSDTGYCVEVEGREVALFKVEDQVYAIDQICPHAGGPLAEGGLHGTAVTCPWHGWDFDVTNGKCSFNPAIQQPVYKVRVEGDEVYVALD